MSNKLLRAKTSATANRPGPANTSKRALRDIRKAVELAAELNLYSVTLHGVKCVLKLEEKLPPPKAATATTATTPPSLRQQKRSERRSTYVERCARADQLRVRHFFQRWRSTPSQVPAATLATAETPTPEEPPKEEAPSTEAAAPPKEMSVDGKSRKRDASKTPPRAEAGARGVERRARAPARLPARPSSALPASLSTNPYPNPSNPAGGRW